MCKLFFSSNMHYKNCDVLLCHCSNFQNKLKLITSPQYRKTPDGEQMEKNAFNLQTI